MRDVGKVISVSVFFVQVGLQKDPRWAETNSNIPPPPGRQDQSKAPPQGQQ